MSIRTLTKETVKKKGLNLKFPLIKGFRGAFAVNETTIDSVKDNLKLLLITNHNERLVHANFGANLRALIFENMTQDLEAQIEAAIVTAVDRWMPFVTIKDINIKSGQSDIGLNPNEVRIKVFFSVNNTDLEDSLEVNLQA